MAQGENSIQHWLNRISVYKTCDLVPDELIRGICCHPPNAGGVDIDEAAVLVHTDGVRAVVEEFSESPFSRVADVLSPVCHLSPRKVTRRIQAIEAAVREYGNSGFRLVNLLALTVNQLVGGKWAANRKKRKKNAD